MPTPSRTLSPMYPSSPALVTGLLLCLLLVMALPAASQEPSPSRSSEPLPANATTDSLLRGIIAEYPDFSGAVYYKHDDHENWLYFSGKSNDALGTEIGPDTNFAIASLSKHIASYLAIDLIKQGKLKFNSKLKDLFQLETRDHDVSNIQVAQLMNHTSGFGQQNCSSRKDIKAMLACATQDKDLIRQYEYSNFGYLLLGKVVEKVSGKSFAEVFSEKILEPLKLNGSGYAPNSQTAIGMIKTPIGMITTDSFIKHSVAYNPVDLADGGLYFTLPDFVTWLKFMQDDPSNEFYLRTIFSTPARLGPYSYGWMAREKFETGYHWHNGAISGFSSNAYWNSGTMLVILTNFDNSSEMRLDEAMLAAVVGRCQSAQDCIAKQSKRESSGPNIKSWLFALGNPLVCWLVLLGYGSFALLRTKNHASLVISALSTIFLALLISAWRLDYTLAIAAVVLMVSLGAWRWGKTPNIHSKWSYLNNVISVFALLFVGYLIYDAVVGYPV